MKNPARVVAAVLSMGALQYAALFADEPVAHRHTFAGTVDYFATGESLGSDTNGDGQMDTLTQPSTVTVGVSDLAADAVLVKAFLYWAASVQETQSGPCADVFDDEVFLTPPGGSAIPVTADLFHCSDTLTGSIDMHVYRADVTSHISSLVGDYTVHGVAAVIANGSIHNASFSIVLVFSAPSLPWRQVQIHDGLQTLSNGDATLTYSGLDIVSPASGKLTWYVLDGDVAPGTTELVEIDGIPGAAGKVSLGDAFSPQGDVMNHTINTQDPVVTDSVGVDIDEFDVSAALSVGDISAQVKYITGPDMWWLAYSVLSYDQKAPPPDPTFVVDGVAEATAFVGDGSTLSGIATDAELAAHAADPNAHKGLGPEAQALDVNGGVSGRDRSRYEAMTALEAARIHPDLFATAMCEALDYRYIDRGDGTVQDCSTGLIWLKDAGCLGQGFWDEAAATGSAQALVARLNDPRAERSADCEDYTAGLYSDWRLPTMAEMCGMWQTGACSGKGCCDAASGLVDTRFADPAVADARGDGQWTREKAFVRVRSGLYWSGTGGWGIGLAQGTAEPLGPHQTAWVWPIRSVNTERP
jgi:hypothetical protein